MHLDVHKEGDWTVIKIIGRLDTSSADEFERRCLDLVEGGAIRVVLDLGELEYVSSAGLRGVLATAKAARAKQGELAVAALQGVTKEVFSISGFDSILPTFPDVASAVAGGGA